MDLQSMPDSVKASILRQESVPIYAGDKLEAMIVPASWVEANRKRALAEMQRICHEVGKRTKNLTKAEIMELMEIDEEEYDALGLGQQSFH